MQGQITKNSVYIYKTCRPCAKSCDRCFRNVIFFTKSPMLNYSINEKTEAERHYAIHSRSPKFTQLARGDFGI